MAHLDEEDIALVLKAIEKRDHEKAMQEHPEDFNKDGSPKVHNRHIKRRVGMVVVVLAVMQVTGHVLHVEVAVKMIEIGVVSFFDWWITNVKSGELDVPKVKIPKIRRKAKAKAVEAEAE